MRTLNTPQSPSVLITAEDVVAALGIGVKRFKTAVTTSILSSHAIPTLSRLSIHPPFERKQMDPIQVNSMTTLDEITAVAAAQPALGNFGFDMDLPLSTSADFLAQVDAARRFILDVPNAGVEIVSRGAYYLKHKAEQHARAYVSVGALIVGAMLEGLKPVRDKYGPNCRFAKT